MARHFVPLMGPVFAKWDSSLREAMYVCPDGLDPSQAKAMLRKMAHILRQGKYTRSRFRSPDDRPPLQRKRPPQMGDAPRSPSAGFQTPDELAAPGKSAPRFIPMEFADQILVAPLGPVAADRSQQMTFIVRPIILPEKKNTIKLRMSANLEDKDPVYIIKPGDEFH